MRRPGRLSAGGTWRTYGDALTKNFAAKVKLGEPEEQLKGAVSKLLEQAALFAGHNDVVVRRETG